MKDLGKIVSGAENIAPKLEDVVKGAMSTVAGTDKASTTLSKHFNSIENSRNALDKAWNKYQKNSQNQSLQEEYFSSLQNLSKRLNKLAEEYDMPKYFQNRHYMHFDDKYVNELKYYVKAIHTFDPVKRKGFRIIFENLPADVLDYSTGSNSVSIRLKATENIYKKIESLNPTQKENFLSLLPGYTGSIDELIVTSRLL